MTLILGIVCEDGVVLAAESAGSDPETQTKQSVDKIMRLGEHRILYGGSGDSGLLQKIEEALTEFPKRETIKRIRQELKARIVPELQESARFHAPYPVMGFNKPPEAVHLFAGVSGGRPWLLEIEKDGRDTLYDERLGNFAAIGSGKPWAQALFRPFLYTPRNLELGKVFAYRVMDDAVELASAYLAPPVRIWTIPVNGEPALVAGDELARLQEVRGIWSEMEADAVGKLLKPRPTPEAEPAIPRPEEAAPAPERAESGPGL